MGLPNINASPVDRLCDDTGTIRGAAVRADPTVTFMGRKIGVGVGSGPALCGKVVVADLARPSNIYVHIDGIAAPAAERYA